MLRSLSKEQNELDKLDIEFMVLSNQHYELTKELNIVTDKLTEIY
ncbi:hypothetical protein [Bacillus sp. AFS002410]|nr:hypothetical protein [Bacillus sp. AFS002410]